MGKRCGNCANGTWLKGMDAVPEVCLECKYVHAEPSNWKEKVQTNADRIRAMSDEELSKILEVIAFDVYNCNECQPKYMRKVKGRAMCDNKCDRCILEWLKQPAEGE